jgi:hypothetical protein
MKDLLCEFEALQQELNEQEDNPLKKDSFCKCCLDPEKPVDLVAPCAALTAGAFYEATQVPEIVTGVDAILPIMEYGIGAAVSVMVGRGLVRYFWTRR